MTKLVLPHSEIVCVARGGEGLSAHDSEGLRWNDGREQQVQFRSVSFGIDEHADIAAAGRLHADVSGEKLGFRPGFEGFLRLRLPTGRHAAPRRENPAMQAYASRLRNQPDIAPLVPMNLCVVNGSETNIYGGAT